jgi:hypothetical protein
MPDQFDDPATATAVDLTELKGTLLLIKPTRVEVGIHTTLGEKDATVADVHVLDGTDVGKVHTEVFIWPRVLQAQLRSTVGSGRYCLGRLGQGVAKPGQNPPWKLVEATDTDRDRARSYLADQAVAAPDTTTDGDIPPWEKK